MANPDKALRQAVDDAWQKANGSVTDVVGQAVLKLAEALASKQFKLNREDAAQEAVLDVLQGIQNNKFQGKSKLSTWAWSVIQMRFRELSREARARASIIPEVSLDTLHKKDFNELIVNKGRKIEAQESEVGIHNSLKRLSVEQQRIVRLHLGGTSFREIGQQLGVSRETAKKRWQAALEELDG